MFSEDVVGLVEEMGFQPSSELSSTDGQDHSHKVQKGDQVASVSYALY